MSKEIIISDLQLRQFIDEVFMRYDYNRSGNLNLPELHIFLNELFALTGVKKLFSYEEAYGALASMDANRDGQISKFELFNLYRFMMQPNYQPQVIPITNFRYGGMGGFMPLGMGMQPNYTGSYVGYGPLGSRRTTVWGGW